MNSYPAGTEVRIKRLHGTARNITAVIVAGPLNEGQSEFLVGLAYFPPVRLGNGRIVVPETVIYLDADSHVEILPETYRRQLVERQPEGEGDAVLMEAVMLAYLADDVDPLLRQVAREFIEEWMHVAYGILINTEE